MKYILLFMAVLFVACTAPPEDLVQAELQEPSEREPQTEGEEVEVVTRSFTFTGYGPGKSHAGTFTNWTADATVNNGTITSFTGTIDASSVDTGIDGLDSHLVNEDFFHVEEYPSINFEGGEQDGKMVGDLEFHGVTKQIAFPINKTGNGVEADFRLNMTPFGITYSGVNEEVRIQFAVKSE